jgi:uncharacterized protein (TIGR00251 family)
VSEHPTPPWRIVPGGVLLSVRATPRASRSVVAGIGADAEGRAVLMVRVAAPPSEGAANAALVDLLAAKLGLRKRDITIRSGETGRNKQVHIAGNGVQIAADLTALVTG